MARKAPAFQFYADDWLGGTCYFSLREEGCYIRLVAFIWSHGQGISEDMAKRVCQGGDPDSDSIVERVLKDKFQQDPATGLWNHHRLIEQSDKRETRIAQLRRAGQLGARKRWGNGSHNGIVTKAITDCNTSHNGIVTNAITNYSSPTPTPTPTEDSALAAQELPQLASGSSHPREVFDLWNSSGAKPAVSTLSSGRLRKLRTRLKDPAWPWREAIARLPVTPIGERGWVPTFDWLIANDENARKLADGNYETSKAKQGYKF